jgi:hypothetical protein
MDKLKDLEILAQEFKKYGFKLSQSEVGPMDSGIASFSNGSQSVTIIKDKSQWSFDSKKDFLASFGLWKSFDSVTDFCKAINILLKNLK